MRRIGTRILLAGVLLGGIASPASAQDLALGSFEGAGPAIGQWLDQLRAGAAGVTWAEASRRFQYRVPERRWTEWVERASAELRALRGRRVVESSFGRDSAPLEPADWIRILFASERPAGGKIMERVLAIRDADSVWRVADYGAWPDPEAIVHNAALDPVPYRYSYYPRAFVHGWRGGIGRLPRKPPPPPDPGSTRSNPRTGPP